MDCSKNNNRWWKWKKWTALRIIIYTESEMEWTAQKKIIGTESDRVDCPKKNYRWWKWKKTALRMIIGTENEME